MAMVRANRLINALEAGTLTGSQLETLLSTNTASLGDFKVLIEMQAVLRRLNQNTTAMNAIAGSQTAVTAIIASDRALPYMLSKTNALTAFSANAGAMTAISASPSTVSTIYANSAAKLKILSSTHKLGAFLDTLIVANGGVANSTLAGLDTATQIASNATAMTAVSANSTGTTAFSFVAGSADAVVAANNAVGKYMAALIQSGGGAYNSTLAGLSTVASIVSDPTALGACFANQSAATAIAGSSSAVNLIAANSSALGTVFAASYGVGAFVDQYIINNGGTSNANLRATNTMSSVASSYYSVISANSSLMALINSNATASGALLGALPTIMKGATNVGAYLDKKMIANGNGSVSGLSALASFNDVCSNAAIVTALCANNSILDIIQTDATVGGIFVNNTTSFNAWLNAGLPRLSVNYINFPPIIKSSPTAHAAMFANDKKMGLYVGGLAVANGMYSYYASTSYMGAADTFADVCQSYYSYWLSYGLSAVADNATAVYTVLSKSNSLSGLLSGSYGNGLAILQSNTSAWVSALSDKTVCYNLSQNATANEGIVSGSSGLGAYLNNVSAYNGGAASPVLGVVNNLDDLLSNNTALAFCFNNSYISAALANSGSACTKIASSQAAMTKLVSYTTGLASFVQKSSAFNAIVASSYKVGAFMNYGINNSTLASLDTIQAVFANSTAVNAIAGSSNMMSYIGKSAVALQALMDSSNGPSWISSSASVVTLITEAAGIGVSQIRRIINNPVSAGNLVNSSNSPYAAGTLFYYIHQLVDVTGAQYNQWMSMSVSSIAQDNQGYYTYIHNNQNCVNVLMGNATLFNNWCSGVSYNSSSKSNMLQSYYSYYINAMNGNSTLRSIGANSSGLANLLANNSWAMAFANAISNNQTLASAFIEGPYCSSFVSGLINSSPYQYVNYGYNTISQMVSDTSYGSLTSNGLFYGSAIKAWASNTVAATAMRNSYSGMQYLTQNSAACTGVLASTTATGLIMDSSYYVGAFLDRLRVSEGLSSNGTLSSLSTISQVVANGTAMTAVVESVSAMAAIISSSSVISQVVGSSTAYNAIIASEVGIYTVMSSAMASAAFFASSAIKTAIYNSDIALAAVASFPAAMASARAATGYTVVSATENGTNPVSIPLGTGTWIILGYSHNGSSAKTATVLTKRSGSTVTNVLTCTATASTAGADQKAAIAVTAPYSFTLNAAGSNTAYFGALRCDV